MRFLSLTNTPECLALAEALTGSPIKIERKHFRSFDILRGNRLGKFFISDFSGQNESVLLPIETLKLCPFVAFRNSISITATSEDKLINTGLICEIHSFGFKFLGCEKVYEMAKLDLCLLPKGASIIEMSEEV